MCCRTRPLTRRYSGINNHLSLSLSGLEALAISSLVMPEVVEEELEERGREVEGSSVFTSEDLALFFRVVICLCKRVKGIGKAWIYWTSGLVGGPSVRPERYEPLQRGQVRSK